MTRYHATPEGNIPFTAEEEAEWDAQEAQSVSETDILRKEQIRQERNNLLKECDWVACSDVTMSDEWRTYRQALRDIPSQEGFPNDVIWPTEPS